MTQAPPPYPYGSPYPYTYPTTDPIAPARRAGLLLIILGVIGLLFGGCIGAAGAFLAAGRIPIPPENPMASMDPQMVKVMLFVATGLVALASLAMIVIGVFARRGSAVACVLGTILCALVSLVLSLQLIGAVGAGGEGLLVLPILAGGIALLILAMVWLVKGAQAAMRAPQLPPMQAYGYPPPGYYPPQQPYGYGQAMLGYYAPHQQQQQPPQNPPSA